MTVAGNKDDDAESFFRRLEKDEKFRKKVRDLLSDNYVTKEELHLLLEELKKQREDFNKQFKEQIAASDRRFSALIENMNERFEESNKRYEELREDTNKRFKELIDSMNKRFEESNKRYEELREDTNRRFEELREDMNKRFEEQDKRIDRRFDKVFERFDELSLALGHDFEEFNSYWLQTFLEELGYPKVDIKKKVFIDDNYEVFPDSKEVKIDLYNSDPLTIGEVTAITRRIDKITLFLRKLKFLEKRLGPAKYKLFITYYIQPEIRDEALKLLSEAGVDVILVRRHKVIKASDDKE